MLRRSRTIGSRVLLVAGTTLIPVLAAGAWAGWSRHSEETLRYRDETIAFTRLASREHGSLEQDLRSTLTTLALVPAVRAMEPTGAHEVLAAAQSGRRGISNLVLVAADGRFAAGAIPPRSPVDLGDREYVRRAATQRAFASGGFLDSRVTGTMAYVGAVPVTAPGGELAGVLTGALDVGWISELGRTAGLGREDVVGIADRQGRIVIRHPDPLRWSGRVVPDSPLLRRIRDAPGAEEFETEGLDDVLRVYAIAPLVPADPAGPWVFAGRPVSVAKDRAMRALGETLTTTGVTALVALVLAVVVARMTFLPSYRSLLAAVRAWAAGDVGARTGLVRSDGDIGEVGAAFDAGADRLGALLAERQARARQLREAVDRFERIAESVSEIFFELDEQGRPLYVSPAWDGIWGIPRSDLSKDPQAFAPLVHPADLGSVRRMLEEAARCGRAGAEYRIVRPDGAARVLRTDVTAARAEDGSVRLVGIMRDLTELRRREQDLRASEEGYRALARRTSDEREADRARIARELHDEFGQSLTALRLLLQALRADAALREEAVRRLVHAISIVDDTFGLVRRIAADLRPPLLDQLGLAEAVRWLAREAARAGTLAVSVEDQLGSARIDPARALASFRIVQESLTNAARHGGAAHATVRLALEGGVLMLEVSDDGQGFPSHAGPAGGLGILGMRERAEALGGTLSVTSEPGRGARVSVQLPEPAAPRSSAPSQVRIRATAPEGRP